ncbi:PREDICTED: kinesin-like protein KIF25 [Bison bison bison]|uniref:Kinesin-like protein n=1 Tax=Bison bison bison TaxID=43346 RepID=A0A6P3J187_BISBB|nr:PREDICTED: kinesin-like protein KIF25 [Bison bison bison]
MWWREVTTQHLGGLRAGRRAWVGKQFAEAETPKQDRSSADQQVRAGVPPPSEPLLLWLLVGLLADLQPKLGCRLRASPTSSSGHLSPGLLGPKGPHGSLRSRGFFPTSGFLAWDVCGHLAGNLLLQELKGNIRVHCRIRPLLPFDDEAQEPVSQDSSVSGGVVHAVDDETVLVECNRPGHALINKTYTFERVYGPAESQRAVFEDVCPLLTSFLDGYNVCIMAYGQTGSGKSFTMLGPHCQEEPALPSEPRGDTGIIPRAAAELFRLISEDPSRSPEVGVSIVEIYNNDIFDLLAKDGCRAASGAKRQVLPTQQGKTVVCGLTYQSVCSAAQFLTLVGGGLKLRVKQPTAVHAESSRSHLVITVTLATAASRRGPSRRPSTPGGTRASVEAHAGIEARASIEAHAGIEACVLGLWALFLSMFKRKSLTSSPRSDRSASAEPCQPGPRSPATGRRQSPPVPLRTRGHGLGRAAPDPLGQVRATLQLVDLAGSECAGVSGVTGPALRETSCINRSLAALSDVLGALAEGRGHIPYRNSRLTHLLQDALGGDAKLQVIVCVSPGQRHVAETLQSLGFGARARQVERGHPAPRKLR